MVTGVYAALCPIASGLTLGLSFFDRNTTFNLEVRHNFIKRVLLLRTNPLTQGIPSAHR